MRVFVDVWCEVMVIMVLRYVIFVCVRRSVAVMLTVLIGMAVCQSRSDAWADENLPDVSHYTRITNLVPYEKYHTATARGVQFSTPDGYLCRITRAPTTSPFIPATISHSYYVICEGHPLPGMPKRFISSSPNDPNFPTTLNTVSVDTTGHFMSLTDEGKYPVSNDSAPSYFRFDKRDLLLASQHRGVSGFPVLPVHSVIQFPSSSGVDTHFEPVTCALSVHHSLSCYAYKAYADLVAGEPLTALGKRELNGFFISPEDTHYFSYRP